jgi:glutamate/tyrosine decarboxylase-like PLP-dependent enzyme
MSWPIDRSILSTGTHHRQGVIYARVVQLTNTGTIDPVQELAQIAHHEGLWYHVDAAYGGFFQLTERGRERLAGIEHADSVVLDPHKCVPIFCIQTF